MSRRLCHTRQNLLQKYFLKNMQCVKLGKISIFSCDLTLLGRIVPCGTMRASPQWPDRAAVHDTSRDYEIRCFLSPGAILSVENTRG